MADQSRAAFDRVELARVEKALAGRFPHKMLRDISRMRMLVDLLGHPEQAYPSIHLTGTNGKTSTARMIDTLLRAFGLRTGRYTSPHLEKVTERISIDGQPAPAEVFVRGYDDVADFVAIVDAQSEEQVTFFELLTAMAFSAFADTPVEVGVIEVGMGGTWDATNVIDGQVQVVTPISLDHRELGDTVAEVATDKSGILRPDGYAILASQTPEAASVLMKKVAELGSNVAREGLEFGVAGRTLALGGQVVSLRGLGGEYDDLFLPLHGAHQAHNAACALAAVEAFLGAGADGPLDIDTVRVGFAAMDSPGRLETIRSSPTIILDGAHNAAGAKALAAALTEDFSFDQLVGVVAILSDKDVGAILSALEPVLSSIVVTQNSSPRAMTIDELANEAVEIFGGDRVEVEPRLDDAIDAAVRMAEDDTPLGGSGVIVTGSLVTVGEARRLLTRGGR